MRAKKSRGLWLERLESRTLLAVDLATWDYTWDYSMPADAGVSRIELTRQGELFVLWEDGLPIASRAVDITSGINLTGPDGRGGEVAFVVRAGELPPRLTLDGGARGSSSLVVQGTATADTIRVGVGTLTVGQVVSDVSRMSRIVVLGCAGNDDIRAVGVPFPVELHGGAGDDILVGGDGSDLLWGDAGNDVVDGRVGDDQLLGGSGDDLLRGGDGDDRLLGQSGHDSLNGGDGSDSLHGGAGRDVLFGMVGNDFLSGNDDDDVLDGGAGNDVVVGGLGDDELHGGSADDVISGGEGNDRLFGDAGNDVLHGGLGDDRLLGGAGDDTLFGDDGADLLDGGEGDDVLVGDRGSDRLFGAGGDDLLIGGGDDDTLHGSAGADYLLGGAGLDELYGGAGDDVLAGNDGADRLVGGTGDDALFGGPGGDALFGDDGSDLLMGDAADDEEASTGGAGLDTLVRSEPLGYAAQSESPLSVTAVGRIERAFHWSDHACLQVRSRTLSEIPDVAPLRTLLGRQPTDTWSYDVVVYGGTSAGVSAAVQAARMGQSVALVEPSSRVGGMTANGLGVTDTGVRSTIGGIAAEFYQAVQRYYTDSSHWTHQSAADYNQYVPTAQAMYRFEPHAAADVFDELLDSLPIAVLLNQRLDRGRALLWNGDRVEAMFLESGAELHGRAFIDATYEGDLLAAAGVSYTTGRESNAMYGEFLNGYQPESAPPTSQPAHPVDAYRVPGDPASGLIAGVEPPPALAIGDADDGVQAYNYRLTLTREPTNRRPFTRPVDYQESRYELLFRYYEAGNTTLPLSLHPLPNRKTDSNGAALVSTDLIGGSQRWAEATDAEREQIAAEHRNYIEGLLWTLAHHSRIPANVRRQMSGWGYAADEYAENGGWPEQLYVREARRMVSDYVVTEQDVRRLRVAPEPIALGSYPADSHYVRRFADSEGMVAGDGSFYFPAGGPFAISYRAIVPRRGEAANLAVAAAVSASHVAYGAIRLEPVYMMLGQSAATAAVLALQQGVAMQDLDYAALRARLVADGQQLEVPPSAASRPIHDSTKMPGVTIDDRDATFTAKSGWGVSGTGWVDYLYRTDADANKGAWSAAYETPLAAGKYTVRLWFSAIAGNASNVPVTVRHAQGETVVIVDETSTSGYVDLGVFSFDNSPARVTLRNAGTIGLVIADAVQFIPKS